MGAVGQQVCGGLPADASYAGEAEFLGAEHACEHLRERRQLNNMTPADRRATAREQHKAFEHAEASLATTAPAEVGAWSVATNPGTQTIGITAVLLNTGKVLLVGGKYDSGDTTTAAYLYDPVTKTGHEVPAPAPVFCGSLVPLSDGRILSVGGANPVPVGIVDLYLFDPKSEQWIRQPDTPLGRYYPSTTKLADGRVLITAGEEVDGTTSNPTVELYTPPRSRARTDGTLEVVGPEHVTGYYPRQWVMPNGQLLQVDRRKSYLLDPATWEWTDLAGLPGGNGAGSAGLMLPGGPSGSSKVLMVGGLGSNGATTSTETYDFADPSAGWSYGTPMPTPRAHLNVVQVPDGSAYAIGGNSTGLYGDGQPETLWYDPATASWTPMAVQGTRRGYHSTAVLLPDGRIMSAGDNGAGGGNQFIDFYSPPYLFKGPRPRITTPLGQLNYEAQFSITTSGPAVTRATLVAPGATTHANDMNTRHVELAVSPSSDGLTATIPNSTVAPPGYYMLFVLTGEGVPSRARWVHVGNRFPGR